MPAPGPSSCASSTSPAPASSERKARRVRDRAQGAFGAAASPSLEAAGAPSLARTPPKAPGARSSGRDGALAARRALAVLLLQKALADADGGGRDLDQLVIGDELDRVLQRQLDGWRQQDRVVLAGGADVGELLGLGRVHHQVVVAAVDPDNHALVELLAGRDEQPAALLQVEQRVGDRLAVLVAHQHAVVAIGNLALHRRKTVEDVTHEAGAAGERQELPLEADQAARRHAVLEARASQ